MYVDIIIAMLVISGIIAVISLIIGYAEDIAFKDKSGAWLFIQVNWVITLFLSTWLMLFFSNDWVEEIMEGEVVSSVRDNGFIDRQVISVDELALDIHERHYSFDSSVETAKIRKRRINACLLDTGYEYHLWTGDQWIPITEEKSKRRD